MASFNDFGPDKSMYTNDVRSKILDLIDVPTQQKEEDLVKNHRGEKIFIGQTLYEVTDAGVSQYLA